MFNSLDDNEFADSQKHFSVINYTLQHSTKIMENITHVCFRLKTNIARGMLKIIAFLETECRASDLIPFSSPVMPRQPLLRLIIGKHLWSVSVTKSHTSLVLLWSVTYIHNSRKRLHFTQRPLKVKMFGISKVTR